MLNAEKTAAASENFDIYQTYVMWFTPCMVLYRGRICRIFAVFFFKVKVFIN